ncbi:hypothetical protein DTL42_13405 [Bremerella cremea]|uniref:Uncharacterized protein n=2 Tax=Bremerella cremea TaxID=1031537 RepID=A0A368KQL1_9BACT|nr:hypothetical protein DTL42_13405 [Bremerella cremea]
MLFVLLVGACSPLLAQEADERIAAELKQASSQQLVELLGADEYPTREAAEAEILTRGEEMVPLVQAARTSPDLEIRIRATNLYQQLLTRLRNDQLKRFLKMDTSVELPGWKRFQQQNGDDEATRKLYVAMLQREWDLLTTMEQQPFLIDYLFFQRSNKLSNVPRFGGQAFEINEGSAAAMFFVASQADVRITQPSMDQLRYLLAVPQLTGDLQDPHSNKPLLSVFENWLKANIELGRFSSEMRYIVLSTCMRENIPSGTLLAQQILADRAKPSSEDGFVQLNMGINAEQQMMFAMLALAKLGSQKNIPEIEAFFDDTSAIQSQLAIGEEFGTELRDVALLAVLHLSGEDPKEYGFSRLANDPTYLYNIRSIGFLSNEERSAAFEKWQQAQKQKQEQPDKKS